MKLAIIHYHLNPGGVTQVVINHLRSINLALSGHKRLSVALLSGGRCDGWPRGLAAELSRLDVSVHTVPALDYDNVRPPQWDLAEQLRSKLMECECDPQDTVLHVHNHSLGKNSLLPDALCTLGQAGFALLLQIHDFAEDFRPDNYCRLTSPRGASSARESSEQYYPQATQVHYATLNSRDFDMLRDAGVEASQLHLLPNALGEVGPLPARQSARLQLAERLGIPVNHRFLLYPVRGIRRKNLGEALLWSALADPPVSFGLTLSPLNPVEQKSYVRWKQMAQRLNLPWAFEAGGASGLSFLENLAASDLLLTTSVAEGFGLVFLESWLVGRPLVGRDLPEITADFVASGLRFPALYERLLVPVDWLPADEFQMQFRRAFSRVLSAYGLPSASISEADWNRIIRDGLVDFSQCPTALQQKVIERVVISTADRGRLLDLNPWVTKALTSQLATSSCIQENAERVRAEYSLASCGRRLLSVYQSAVASERATTLKPLPFRDRILSRFLNPLRFHPLRVES